MENIKFYQIADLLDLEYDGDVEDTRLHGKEKLNWGAETEEDYEKAAKEIDAISYEGKGWRVYAWYDISGYDYFMVQREEPNYIQITVLFDNEDIDRNEIPNIQKAIDSAYEDAYSISERYDYTPNSEYRRGGRIKSALMRDRKYKSNEPHEQAYKRKSRPKNRRYSRYKNGGGVGETYGSLYQSIVEAVMKDIKVSREKAESIVDENQGWLTDMIEYEGETNVEFLADQITTTDEGLYANGGNVGRDLLFKSQEPHEQAYKRKREWKEYKKDGWLGEWFREGGDVGDEVFESLYKKYRDKDYFFTNERIENKIKNWEYFVEKGDENAMKYTKEDIINNIEDISKAEAFITYSKLKEAIQNNDKQYLKSRIRYDQKFSKDIFENLTGKKLPNTNSEIIKFLDSNDLKIQKYANGGGVGQNFEDWLKQNNIEVYKRTYYWVADDGKKDYRQVGTKAEVMKALKDEWKSSKFANGGNVGRDLLFKSQEPHEQAYKRKREWKEYKKEGWLGEWFKDGGGVEDNFDYGSDLTDEAMVKQNLMNGEISCETLTKIIGCEPSYPYQIVGAIKLEKCYLRPYYKLA